MLRQALLGIVAGAAGTMALDITTYGDMLLRGRAASNVPADVAGWTAAQLGIAALSPAREDAATDNRRSAAGALLGYTVGLGIGGVYGLLRSRNDNDRVSVPLAGAAVGIVAMIASDLPIAVSGASDPRTWTPVDWASDLIPHLVYGIVTVGTFETLMDHAKC
jgi:hypothetical protein